MTTTSDEIGNKLQSAADQAGDLAAHAGNRISDKLDRAANKLRDKLPDDSRLSSVADSVKSGIERTGDYLRDSNLRSVGSDLQGIVRKYPVQASLVGFGLGIFLGRALVNRASAEV